MSSPPKPPKRKLTGARFAARFAAEKALQQRRYCDALASWRDCRRARCRHDRACRGDPNACLKHAVTSVTRQTQWQVREDILAATPDNIGAPERAARLCMPADFYAETIAQAVARYLESR